MNKSPITVRERYRRHCHFEKGMLPANFDMGPSMPAYERWLKEGLSPDLDPRRYNEWCDAFGLDHWFTSVEADTQKEPLFEEIVVEENERTITRRRSDGSIQQDNKGWHRSIPHEIRPAVTTRAEWDRLKEWMDVDAPLPDPKSPALAKTLQEARESVDPVRIRAGSMVGMARNWVGFEKFCLMQYEDPEWLDDIFETNCRAAERQVRIFGENKVPIEAVHFWEDICYKNGPMISPDTFRHMVVPRYRRVADLAMSYGYDRVSVDSDGNIWALLDEWLSGGVNVLWPLEVQAGMDINELQAKYHGRMYFLGGIHKYRLTEGEGEIVQELKRIKPAMDMGGYHPHLDHNIPNDVSFKNFLSYLKLRYEILGLGSGILDPARFMLKSIHAN